MKTRIFVLALLCHISFLFGADNQGQMVFRQTIFNGNKTLTSREGAKNSWQQAGSFSLPAAMLVSGSGEARKWRLRIFYKVDKAADPLSLQARIALNTVQSPIFNLGWDKGASGGRDAYTQWMQPDLLGMSDKSQFPVSFNLIRSPGSKEAQVRLQLVELEIWEDLPAETYETRYAHASSPLASRRPQATAKPSAQQPPKTENNAEAALDAGLGFLKAAAAGSSTDVQALLSGNVVALNSLERLNSGSVPLLQLPAGLTFEDYLANYEPRIFSYAEFENLFDDWESHFVNGWQISSKSYLFIGNQLKPWGHDILAGQPLVFVLEEEAGTMKVKAFPD